MECLQLRDTNRVVFVAFRDSERYFDPSDTVISRIRSRGIPAVKASEAIQDEHTNVTDKSGKPGIIYYAGVLRWLTNSKVEVIKGSEYASLGAGCTIFIMANKDGKWVRIKTKKMVVS